MITLAAGLLAGIGAPASAAATPARVGTSRLPAAAALNGMGNQLGNLGGPALAGVLIAGPGLAACYGVDAARFVAFSTALLFVPSGLFPALASEHFHGGSATFGLLAAAPGFGAMVGAATSGWTGRVRRPGMVIIGAGMVWGIAIVGFGLTRSLAVGLAFLALAGGGDMISEILRNALLQIGLRRRRPPARRADPGPTPRHPRRPRRDAGPGQRLRPGSPRRVTRLGGAEALVDGLDQRHLAVVVDQVHVHPVHHVGERDPRLP